LIVVFHKIITTGHQRLQPLFDCLLTILVNGEPTLCFTLLSNRLSICVNAGLSFGLGFGFGFSFRLGFDFGANTSQWRGPHGVHRGTVMELGQVYIFYGHAVAVAAHSVDD